MRTDFRKYSKLGLRRKSIQKYRKAKGRDNKIRQKFKGHLRNISIGFKSDKDERGKIHGLIPKVVYNIEDIKNIQKNEIVIIGKVGDKKRLELANYAIEKNIKVANINPKKIVEKVNSKIEKSKEEKKKKEERKKAKEKRNKESEKKEKEDKKEEKTNEEDITKKEVLENNEKTKTKETKKQIQTNNYGRGK